MTKHSWTCLRGVLGSYRACTSVLQEENFAGNSQGGGCACCPGNSALSREGHSTPKLPWRSPSKGQSMDMPPTHTKHLGCLPCRTRGLLPDKFPALQGRTKHSRAACHSSRSHAPSPNIRNALWGSTLEIWGYYLALPLSPEETSTLPEMPARNMGHLTGMHPPQQTQNASGGCLGGLWGCYLLLHREPRHPWRCLPGVPESYCMDLPSRDALLLG